MTAVLRRRPAALLALALALPLAGSPAAEPPAEVEWKFDRISFNKTEFHGLILDETATEIRFQDVRLGDDHPTVSVVTTFPKKKVQVVARLGADERKELLRRLRALDPTGKLEDERVKPLKLKPAVWKWGQESKEALRPSPATHFRVFSTARRDVVERAVVRLEEIYAAYTLHLPPRRPARGKEAGPLFLRSVTTILLVQSLDEYREMLRSQGRNILNPAFYDADNNEVVCASELQELGDKLQRIREEHERKLKMMKQEEAKAALLPEGEVRDRVLKQIRDARTQIIKANAENEAQFRKATQELFQTLYHEAFHAYLANFVYPPADYKVPRWLNEGLAQVFETATVEDGVPRFNSPDPVRLERLKQAFAAARAEDGLVPLDDLLRSQPEQFLVAKSSARARRDAARHYLTSWALAYYLTFDRQLLGTKALDQYVEALTADAEPRAAFAKLVGQPVGDFEKDFHEAMKKRAGPSK